MKDLLLDSPEAPAGGRILIVSAQGFTRCHKIYIRPLCNLLTDLTHESLRCRASIGSL